MEPSREQILRRLYTYIAQYKFRMIAGFVFILLANSFQVAIPWVLKYAIDFVTLLASPHQSIAARTLSDYFNQDAKLPITILLCFVGLMIGLAAFQGLFRFLMRFNMIGVSRNIEYLLRNDYFIHLQKLSKSFFHRSKTGDLMARATNDLNAVRMLLGPGIMHLGSTIITFIITIIMMININVYLTVFALIPLPFVAFTVNRMMSRIRFLFTRIQEQFSSVTARAQESISGIRVIKSYVQEENEIKTFSDLNREFVKRNLALVRVRATLMSSIELLLGMGGLFILWIGGRYVVMDKITIGGFAAFLSYLGMLAWPMIALGWVVNLWQQGLASMGRIMKIMGEEPEISDSDRTRYDIKEIDGHIEFKNVSFRYDDRDIVLSNINLDIPQGSTVAIVGHTGYGKSTLVDLVPRLFDVTEGQILIDGHDIREIPLQVLRKNIGYVPQETFLFSDTLEKNIGFGLKCPTTPEIEEAAVVSQIRVDMEQLPEGYKTVVGERGVTLSGGQKQRTSISRAVIQKPNILILDDALSSVDTYTEDKILKRLRTFMNQRTTIIVSHRISTIRDADMIVVLDNGQIVERGTHAELLTQQGIYSELYAKQALEEALERI